MTNTSCLTIPETPAGRPEVVAAFYKFAALERIETIKAELESLCKGAGLAGTILLAREGINGTVCGPRDSIARLLNWLRGQDCFAGLSAKFSFAEKPAFHRMKVRLKKEIVTMGEPDINPRGCVGHYVKPKDWNALVSDPDTLLIDTRNGYEVAIGTFENAINPHTNSFREFPGWVKDNLDPLPVDKRPKNIAMFCTGGIRCEKATSYLVAQGYENIFHLEGGILKYLETVAPEESTWRGDCFVFDERVSVRHGLEPGDYDMCHACRMPLAPEDKQSPWYEAGASCPKCHESVTPEQKARFRERQKQVQLARERGERHIGVARLTQSESE